MAAQRSGGPAEADDGLAVSLRVERLEPGGVDAFLQRRRRDAAFQRTSRIVRVDPSGSQHARSVMHVRFVQRVQCGQEGEPADQYR